MYYRPNLKGDVLCSKAGLVAGVPGTAVSLLHSLVWLKATGAALGPWIGSVATPLKFRCSILLLPSTFFSASPCTPPGDGKGHCP